jgi:hypothetical protein
MSTEQPRSLYELAKEALSCQDASNLCGLAQTYARVMRDLMAHGQSTTLPAQHPISRLWLGKMAALAGIYYNMEDGHTAAYSECMNIKMEHEWKVREEELAVHVTDEELEAAGEFLDNLGE